jgi:hypothetical protein
MEQSGVPPENRMVILRSVPHDEHRYRRLLYKLAGKPEVVPILNLDLHEFP